MASVRRDELLERLCEAISHIHDKLNNQLPANCFCAKRHQASDTTFEFDHELLGHLVSTLEYAFDCHPNNTPEHYAAERARWIIEVRSRKPFSD